MHVANHHSLEELKRLAKAASDANQFKRIQIVVLAKQGKTAPQIAASLNLSRRRVQEWVYRYNADGLSGLKDGRGGPYSNYLTPAQEEELMTYVDQAAEDPRQGIRRGQDLRKWIEKQFGVLYSLDGVYKLLRRLGYSWLMPRPRHANADPEARADFKKKLPPKLIRLPRNTRKNVSKSGSKMKPGSANKAR